MHRTPKAPEGQGRTLLDFALAYRRRGWSIIPIGKGTKKPPRGLKWKPYQSKPPTEAQLITWFATGKHKVLAVITGAASGGLVCRDFDTMESYQRWAREHPNLAKTLPTVATARGRHVYFRATPSLLFFRDLRPEEEGEYRGDTGHFCLLPPSPHPDGPTYRWLVPLPDGELPFIDDVVAADFLPHPPCNREDRENTGLLRITEAISGGGGIEQEAPSDKQEPVQDNQTPTSPIASVILSNPLFSAPSAPSLLHHDDQLDEIEHALLESLPESSGQRNRQVFELARALKAVPWLADATVDDLEPYVRRWHELGLAKGVIGTKPFEETWIDFSQAWPKVKFPKGEEPMAAIFRRAQEAELPHAAQKYEQEGVRLLLALCRELQRASGENPFFLGCRTAGRLLGVDHTTAWRWLFLLQRRRDIEEVEKGSRSSRRASRWRYRAD